MGRGPAVRSQQQAGVERMGGVGLGRLEGWRAPGAPSFSLPFAPLVQVDPGLSNMQAACPASLLRIGWKEL